MPYTYRTRRPRHRPCPLSDLARSRRGEPLKSPWPGGVPTCLAWSIPRRSSRSGPTTTRSGAGVGSAYGDSPRARQPRAPHALPASIRSTWLAGARGRRRAWPVHLRAGGDRSSDRRHRRLQGRASAATRDRRAPCRAKEERLRADVAPQVGYGCWRFVRGPAISYRVRAAQRPSRRRR
jgi:hypothetical protein